MTSQVVGALERRGLMKRSVHPSDKRAWALAVTSEGRTLANKAIIAVEACDDAFFFPIEDRVAVFTKTLRVLRMPH